MWAVIRVIIIKRMIRIMRRLNFPQPVKHAIHRLHGHQPIGIMMIYTFQSIAGTMITNGINARIAIAIRMIIQYLLVLPVIIKGQLIRSIKG